MILEEFPEITGPMVILEFLEKKMLDSSLINKFKDSVSKIMDYSCVETLNMEAGTCILIAEEDGEEDCPAYIIKITLHTGKHYLLTFPVDNDGFIFNVHNVVDFTANSLH